MSKKMSEFPLENDPAEYAARYSELNYNSACVLEMDSTTALIKKHSLPNGKLTLDYGCGPGFSTQFLKTLGLTVEGVDINSHMISKAQQRDPIGKYELIKSGEIQRISDFYDLVYAGWSIVHVKTKEEMLKIFREIARVIKPGGTFILVVNTDETYKKEWIPIETRFQQNQNIFSGSVVATQFKENGFIVYSYFWKESDYLEMLEKAGLTVVEIDKPLGTDGDGHVWINEKEFHYVAVYAAKKL